MNIIKFAWAIILLTLTISAFGQDQPKEVKKIGIHDFFIYTGVSSTYYNSPTLSEFQSLAPQSELLDKNFSNYSSYLGSSGTSSGTFSAMVGLQFRDKQKTSYKKSPLLRLGLSYFSTSTISGGLYKTDRQAFDTLTSSQSGQLAFVDSIYSNNYSMNYSSDQLRFDASLIFRTNPEARWSIYSGIGISTGFSINAYTDIYYGNFSTTETTYANGSTSISYNTNGEDNQQSERFKNKTNFGASTYIPMGLDFRLANKGEFGRRIHLFYEIRPSLTFTSIPELSTYANVGIHQGLGLRVSWM
jgi:hypothetical protein